MESLSRKRDRFDSESESISVKTKRIRDDLLEALEDSVISSVSPELDLFIKSFENEISQLPASVADLDSASGESRPDLGFLFEASDDELGLPPTDLTPVELGLPPTDLTPVESVELGEVWGLDDQFCTYDSFEYEIGYAGGDADNSNDNYSQHVAIDGLFDYTELGFVLSELPPHPDIMPDQ